MSSTLFPVESKNGNEDEMKKLEEEIEALRCSTQQAIQKSFQDADRIRDEIFREIEKKNAYEEQLKKITESPLGKVESDEVNEIMELISSNGFDGSSHVTQVESLLSSFSQNQEYPKQVSAEMEHFSMINTSGNVGKRRESIKNFFEKSGEVCTSLAGSFLQPIKEKKKIDSNDLQTQTNDHVSDLAATWHGSNPRIESTTNKKNDGSNSENVIRAKSSVSLNMLGMDNETQVKVEREGLEKELLNEIFFFEQLSQVTMSELENVLREKDEVVVDLERKIRSQQSQVRHIQEAIERTKICLAGSTLHVDFPEKEEKQEIECPEDDKSFGFFSKSSSNKANRDSKKQMPRNTSFQSLIMFGKQMEGTSE